MGAIAGLMAPIMSGIGSLFGGGTAAAGTAAAGTAAAGGAAAAGTAAAGGAGGFLSNLGPLMQGFGMASSVFGTAAQGRADDALAKAQAAQYDYQAQVALNNARIAEMNALTEERLAEDALARGAIEERQHRLKISRLVGAQRAGLAAAGADVAAYGTPLSLLEETAEYGELDALAIRSSAAREAWGFGQKAWNFRNEQELLKSQAGAYRTAGSNVMKASRTKKTSTYLGGAGTFASRWLQFNI